MLRQLADWRLRLGFPVVPWTPTINMKLPIGIPPWKLPWTVLRGGAHDSEFASTGRALSIFTEVHVSEWMKSLSGTGKTCSFWCQDNSRPTMAAWLIGYNRQNNHLVLNYPFAEQGGICAIANKTCCTWINLSGEVETQLHKIREQAPWPNKFHLMNPGPLMFFAGCLQVFWAPGVGPSHRLGHHPAPHFILHNHF